VCVHCNAPLCFACITKIDGINHCQACLSARVTHQLEQDSRAPGAAGLPTRWLGVGLGVGLLSALCWLMLNVLLPPAGAP
jgi:hypothetical protein